MVTLTKSELLSEVVRGISGKLNKKALTEVLDSSTDLNEVLYNYYQRAHYISPDHRTWYSFEEIDLKDAEHVEYLKDLGAKKYRQAYDYTRGKLSPIKQRNTGFGAEFNNGWTSRWSWLFNVYKYIEFNNIDVTEEL